MDRFLLFSRQFVNNGNECDNFNGNNNFDNNNCNSRWSSWGRWVFLAAVIIFFLIVAVGFACLNSRRRRRSGLSPRYGTGWAAGKTPIGHSAPQYNQNYGNENGVPPYSAPPPVYGQNTGNTFNSNEGYYGSGQETGIELQPPQQVYGAQAYAPPTGAPPRTKN